MSIANTSRQATPVTQQSKEPIPLYPAQSIRVSWAINQRLPIYQAMLLILISHMAGSVERGCFASMATLASKCGMGLTSVYEAFNALEAAGLIFVRGDRRKRTFRCWPRCPVDWAPEEEVLQAEEAPPAPTPFRHTEHNRKRDPSARAKTPQSVFGGCNDVVEPGASVDESEENTSEERKKPLGAFPLRTGFDRGAVHSFIRTANHHHIKREERTLHKRRRMSQSDLIRHYLGDREAYERDVKHYRALMESVS